MWRTPVIEVTMGVDVCYRSSNRFHQEVPGAAKDVKPISEDMEFAYEGLGKSRSELFCDEE